MAENKKEATERLRQLANSNFKNDEVKISISYDIRNNGNYAKRKEEKCLEM